MSLLNSIGRDLKSSWDKGDPIIRLIFINIVVFVIYIIAKISINVGSPSSFIASEYDDALLRWVGFSICIPEFVYKPWTWISFQFMHADPFHILWNMLFLYWFGEILQSYIGNKRTYTLYFFGGLAGAFLALIVFACIPSLGKGFVLIGASAGCSAIMLASAAIAPDHTIFLILIGPVKLKYLVLVKFILDLASFAWLRNPGGSLAHIGGSIFGFLLIQQLQQGNDWDEWIRKPFSLLKNIENRRRPKMKATVQSTKPIKDQRSIDAQKKIDSILDKINASGYDSLTKDEKEFLFKYSKD